MCTDVLRFGSSSILGAERSSSFRFNVPPTSLPRAVSNSERLLDSKQLSIFDYDSARNGSETVGFVGDNVSLYARKFDVISLSLNLRAKEKHESNSENPANKNGSAIEKMPGSGFSASSTSRRALAAPAALQDRLQGLHNSFARVPEPDLTLVTEEEDRMARLKALAALRQGRILGDSRVFRQTFVIRSYEVGTDGRTSIDTIVSFFQEVAINHFSLMGVGGKGFGATPNMNRYRLIWVITRLHVEVERYPAWPEAVDIDSWTDNAGKNGMRISWLIRQQGTEEIIAKGTSTWAMMNQDTRRLSKMPEDVRSEIEPTFKRPSEVELVLNRIAKLDNTAEYIKSNLSPRGADLDGNNHVNNVTYVRWVLESVPTKTSDTHDVRSLSLEYRRECNKDSVVESLTDIEQNTEEIGDSSPATSLPSQLHANRAAICSESPGLSLTSNDSLAAFYPCINYTHLLRMQEGRGEEIVRGRTVWKHRGAFSETIS